MVCMNSYLSLPPLAIAPAIGFSNLTEDTAMSTSSATNERNNFGTIGQFIRTNGITGSFCLLGTKKYHHVVNVAYDGFVVSMQLVDGDWTQSLGLWRVTDAQLGLFIDWK